VRERERKRESERAGENKVRERERDGENKVREREPERTK
jgi:hypothetical protein